MMKYGRLAIVACALVVSIAVAAAESPSFLDNYLSRAFPENADARKQYWTSLITVPKEGAWSFKEKVLPTKAGSVKLGAQKRDSDFVVQFQNGTNGVFSPWSQGSFSIVRDSKTGFFLQVKIFLQDDPSCYIRLYPQAEATRLDVVMYGAVLKKGLYVPGLIYYVLDDTVASIIGQTRDLFDWGMVFGNGLASPQAAFADSLREAYSPQVAAAAMPLPSLQALQPAPAQPSLSSGPGGIQPLASALSSASPSLPPIVAPQPPAGILPRPQALAAMAVKSASAEAFASGLAARGETWAELAPPAADAPVLASGFADDSDPLAPKLPYKSLARYEAGKGLPLAQLRAAIYLDSLQNPGSVYAVLGESLRCLAVPSFGVDGRSRIAFFSDQKELDWAELSKSKDGKVRVLRIATGD